MTVPTQQSLTRFVQGTQVPIAATWVVDTDHTEVRFIARHLVVAKVRGRVPVLEGEVVIADDPVQSFVRATLDLAGIDTGSAERDEHLRSADFFDVTNHPTASFISTNVTWAGAGAVVTGDLTIGGVTRPVELDVEFLGVGVDPDGYHRAAFSASTEIDREDYGITWNQKLDTGGVLIGRTVRIELDVQTYLAP